MNTKETPREPTQEMIEAGATAWCRHNRGEPYDAEMPDIWRSMWDAAPPVAQPDRAALIADALRSVLLRLNKGWSATETDMHKIADAITALSITPAEPQWIAVSERLPDTPDGHAFGQYSLQIIVWVRRFGPSFGKMIRHTNKSIGWSVSSISGEISVTHWMPLPEPPHE